MGWLALGVALGLVYGFVWAWMIFWPDPDERSLAEWARMQAEWRQDFE